MILYVPLYPEETSAAVSTVCVTGGAGYVAGPIIERLLAAGHTVHATVRDPSNEKLLAKLKGLPGAPERLKFFKADLMQPGSFTEAVQGCKYVLHTASPFFTPKNKSEVQSRLLEPAINGTKHVLEAVNATPSVERVVLTSSVAAIYGDCEYKGKGVEFTEEDWAEGVSDTCLPYHLSKRMAEEKAWEMAKAQSRWKLVVINPSFVVGPPVGDRADSTSVHLISDMFNGKVLMIPRISLGAVDVRDVAAAHCLAMVHPNAQGRYICSEATYSMLQLGQFIKEKHAKARVPNGTAPSWLVSLVGPLFGRVKRDFLQTSLDKVPLFNHSKIERELGFEFHPAKTAVQEMVDKLIALGRLQPTS